MPGYDDPVEKARGEIIRAMNEVMDAFVYERGSKQEAIERWCDANDWLLLEWAQIGNEIRMRVQPKNPPEFIVINFSVHEESDGREG